MSTAESPIPDGKRMRCMAINPVEEGGNSRSPLGLGRRESGHIRRQPCETIGAGVRCLGEWREWVQRRVAAT
jgi:hypothetical protein